MPKETKTSRPTLTQNKISFSCLAERIGLENAEITWRHLSPEAVRDDAQTATCYTVTEARRRFSSKMANHGKCPACPLALINRNDPASYIRTIQLRERIMEAKPNLDPLRWLKEWQPQVAAIDTVWLPMFSLKVRKHAEPVMLPSIPEVE